MSRFASGIERERDYFAVIAQTHRAAYSIIEETTLFPGKIVLCTRPISVLCPREPRTFAIIIALSVVFLTSQTVPITSQTKLKFFKGN